MKKIFRKRSKKYYSGPAMTLKDVVEQHSMVCHGVGRNITFEKVEEKFLQESNILIEDLIKTLSTLDPTQVVKFGLKYDMVRPLTVQETKRFKKAREQMKTRVLKEKERNDKRKQRKEAKERKILAKLLKKYPA